MAACLWLNAWAMLAAVSTQPTERPAAVLENEAVRIVISADGRLRSLVSKASGVEYAVADSRQALFEAYRGGKRFSAVTVEQAGDLIQVRFQGTDIAATFQVTTRSRYFLIEVRDVQPADVESLALLIGVRPLAVQAGPMGATYDEAFAVAHTAVTPNTIPWVLGSGSMFILRAGWYRHLGGIRGGRSVLVACPRAQFLPTLEQMERETGLPCPMLDGRWARLSETAHRSYLFVTGGDYGDIDALIGYAKIGGFHTLLFLMNMVFKNYGHYEINTACFPEGLKSLQEAVARIHAAGLKAGVHLFGPSVSVNDPYVHPKPDDRLYSVPLPALAAEVDAAATEIALAADPGKLRSDVVRLGDEIVVFEGTASGPGFRLVKCQRGAFGTAAAAHQAGTPVRALFRIDARYNFLLADGETSILHEMTERLGHIVNTCRLDMVYFDGAGGFHDDAAQRIYFLQKWLPAYYRAFDHDVLVQYSSGTGHGLLWHMIPRAASADGHGDLKGYLDSRLKFILRMADSFTVPDVGWYGLDLHWKPDQLEYVAARCLAVNGSISVQASREILDSHARAREIMEMLGRYERCRLAAPFSASVRQKLLEERKDFRLFEDRQGRWTLYRAFYYDDHPVSALDGQANVWTVSNPLDRPCRAAVEIERRAGLPASPGDYDRSDSLVLADADNMDAYEVSDHNRYVQYVLGPGKRLTPQGPVSSGVIQQFGRSADGGRRGGACLVFTARNTDVFDGWGARGKRFPRPLDLSRYPALGVWVHGDGRDETLYFQLVDKAGRVANFHVPVHFKGWRFWSFARKGPTTFDWTQVEYVILYLIRIGRDVEASVRIEALKALAAATMSNRIKGISLEVAGRRLAIPRDLGAGQCVTTDGLGACTFWPGGMKPGEPLAVENAVLMLAPGDNPVVFRASEPAAYPGDVSVRISRLWPMED